MTVTSFPSTREIETVQLLSLRALLSELIPANPYYRERLKREGVDASISSILEFIQRTPFTTKDELVRDQEAHPPYGTNLTYPIEDYIRLNRTSGSTGTPLRCLDTRESWDWMLDNWTRVYEAAGVDRSDRVFFAFSFGPFLGFWTAWDSATKNGFLCLPGGGVSSYARLLAIIENQATVLLCTPTYALRLAEVARTEDVDLSKAVVRAIIVAGEPGGSVPATRSRIREAWNGARVVDHHGMTEVGPVSYECPQNPGSLHIIESSYIAEIIDPASGQPVDEGGTGELVLTTLGRSAMPLLRYRTKDIVRRGSRENCACGRSELSLPGGIIGRTDDMIPIRGVNVSPSVVEGVVHKFRDVAEFRVEIRGEREMKEIEVCIETVPDCADPERLAQRLVREFHHTFSLRIPVTIVPEGSLPRFEMKNKRWVRLDTN